MNIETIRQMLEAQYKPFIREKQYIDAFEQAMHVFDELNPEVKGSSDPFYFFLHQLILHLVERIGELEKELEILKKD